MKPNQKQPMLKARAYRDGQRFAVAADATEQPKNIIEAVRKATAYGLARVKLLDDRTALEHPGTRRMKADEIANEWLRGYRAIRKEPGFAVSLWHAAAWDIEQQLLLRVEDEGERNPEYVGLSLVKEEGGDPDAARFTIMYRYGDDFTDGQLGWWVEFYEWGERSTNILMASRFDGISTAVQAGYTHLAYIEPTEVFDALIVE